MHRAILLLLGSAFIPGVLISAPLGAPHPVNAGSRSTAGVDRLALPTAEGLRVTMTTEDANPGCTVNVSAVNHGDQRTAISRDSEVRSYVGVFAGPWKKLGQSVWINPGQTARWHYDLTFGCNDPREYRFVVKKFDSKDTVLGEHTYRYPANPQQATVSVSFSLGDLNRFF